MAFSNRKRGEIFSEINITPLTDIFLVLLIIMMVIAPLLDQQGLKLLVPNEQEVQQVKETKTLSVEVSEKGEYMIDGKLIPVNGLVEEIKQAAQTKKDGLLIKAANDATHGAVVQLMDAARTAGVTSISVIEK